MKFKAFLLAGTILIIIGCGGQNSEEIQENGQRSPSQLKAGDAATPSATATVHPGKKVYDSTCLVCHMANGSGVPGMHPPLIKTDGVNGDKERLIRITLQGLSGKIEVNGRIYNSVMPPNSHLSNSEVADVLTYIRQNFGNNSSEVTEEEVRRVRNSF